LHKWIKPFFFVNGWALIRRTPVNCNIKKKHKYTKTCPALDDLLLSFVLTQSFFDEPNVKSNCLILRAWRRSQPKAQEGRFGEISAKAHFYINIIKMFCLHLSTFYCSCTHTHTLLTMIFWNVSKWSNWILQNQYFSLALVEKLNDDDVMMTVTLNFQEL